MFRIVIPSLLVAFVSASPAFAMSYAPVELEDPETVFGEYGAPIHVCGGGSTETGMGNPADACSDSPREGSCGGADWQWECIGCTWSCELAESYTGGGASPPLIFDDGAGAPPLGDGVIHVSDWKEPDARFCTDSALAYASTYAPRSDDSGFWRWMDEDHDRLRDGCEYFLAMKFRPDLEFDEGEPFPTERYMLPFFAAKPLDVWEVDESLELLDVEGTVLGGVSIFYALGYANDYGKHGYCDHFGDSEFIIVRAWSVEDPDTGRATWIPGKMFLSNHGAELTSSSWYRPQLGASPADDRIQLNADDEFYLPAEDHVMYEGWNPHIFVSREKHANYPTRSMCEDADISGPYGEDCGCEDCSIDNWKVSQLVPIDSFDPSREPGTGLYERPAGSRNLGAGGVGNQLRDQITITRDGVDYHEWLWGDGGYTGRFCGWQIPEDDARGVFAEDIRCFLTDVSTWCPPSYGGFLREAGFNEQSPILGSAGGGGGAF